MTVFCCLGQLVHCWVPQYNLQLCDDYSRLVWIHFVLQKGPWVEVNINWRTFTSIVHLRTKYSYISPTTPILLARWYDHYHYHHPRVPEQTCHAICLEIRKLKYLGYKYICCEFEKFYVLGTIQEHYLILYNVQKWGLLSYAVCMYPPPMADSSLI